MEKITVLSVHIVCILHKTTSQYLDHYNPQLQTQQGYYQPQTIVDYDSVPSAYQGPKHHKRKYNFADNIRSFPYGDYSDSYLEECKCDCISCEEVKPCCKDVCTDCNAQNSQSNLVFVPYPYPLVVHGVGVSNTPAGLIKLTLNNTSTAITTPSTTTTSTVTTTPSTVITTSETTSIRNVLTGIIRSSALENKYPNMYIDGPLNRDGRNKYIVTSLRRTKPTWLPKYGIVPIPDQLAEKLMSQIRNMKGLQSRKYYD